MKVTYKIKKTTRLAMVNNLDDSFYKLLFVLLDDDLSMLEQFIEDFDKAFENYHIEENRRGS